MFSVKKNREECGRLRDTLEVSGGVADLPIDLERHLAACADCQAVADELAASQALLRNMRPSAAEPGPWFASRVMATIASRELDLQRAQDTWMVLPRLAARLTWISALALLLAGTWLYQSPNATQKSGNESGIESLFDTSPSSAPQDDVLVNLERAQ